MVTGNYSSEQKVTDKHHITFRIIKVISSPWYFIMREVIFGIGSGKVSGVGYGATTITTNLSSVLSGSQTLVFSGVVQD